MVQCPAVAPSVVDAREASLSPPPSTHRHRTFCCRSFVPLSFRSVHLSSRPETIRCIHPSLSRSVSPLFCPSVSASVAQFICLQGQSPLDAFILCSLVPFLLCSAHISLVAVFFPIKIQ